MYLMLTGGVPPFNGKEDAEIIAKVKTGKYSQETLEEAGVSKDVINFIAQLLVLDPNTRISPDQALQHSWIQRYMPSKEEVQEHAQNYMPQLSSFKPKMKLL